jgi:transposase
MLLNRGQIGLLLLYEWLQKSLSSKSALKINLVYDEKTMTIQTASKWFNRFETNKISLKDKKHIGRPREIDKQRVIDAII